MDFGRGLMASIVVFLIVALAAQSSAQQVSVSAQGSDALLKSSVVFVVQGDIEVVPGNETNNDFYLLRILTFSLPHDVTRVHTKVPSSAEDFVVWTTTGEINNTGYGIEASGPFSGDFYIDVPSSHPRTTYATNVTDDISEFNASGSQFVNTTYSNDSLQLIPGNDSGEYISAPMPVLSAFTIASATLIYDGNSTSNITSYMSNDGGTTWMGCANNTEANFTATGTVMKVRFAFDGNSSAGFEPFVSSFSINATYVLNSTIFSVHMSCTWTQSFLDRRATLDLSEAADFSSDGSYLLMLYLVPGYGIENSGLDLTFDEGKTMSSYLDKDLYFNMTFPSSGTQSFSVTLLAPQKQGQMLYYVAAAGLVIALGLAYFASRRSGTRAIGAKEDDEVASIDADREPLSETDEVERKELVGRKKEILAEIDVVKAQSSSGKISKYEADAKLSDLKKEFKVVRNELNRLSRKSSIAATEPAPEPSGASTQDYESVLAALAKIDDDFEKGRLPEGTHKSLREEYISKATKLRAAQELQRSPLDLEKDKLMGAILALDDEREKGEIDEKLYTELKASYRKQLVELMKRSEE